MIYGKLINLSDQTHCCYDLLIFVLQIVLYRQDEVLECECDMAMVHHLLSQIPQDLPYETLISRAGDLFVQFPPSELAREAASHEQYLISKPNRYIYILTKENLAAVHPAVY